MGTKALLAKIGRDMRKIEHERIFVGLTIRVPNTLFQWCRFEMCKFEHAVDQFFYRCEFIECPSVPEQLKDK